MVNLSARAMLREEACALLTRLASVKPFVLHETMVPAAMPTSSTLKAVERCLMHGKKQLADQVHQYLRWLGNPGAQAMPVEMQRRLVSLRLRFNDVLSQFDIFADAITQRSEHETGAWLAGLDRFAIDALLLRGNSFKAPPVLCYLDRGHGAAIRRAKTRLPGGEENPVAVVRIPRERMVGSGIASSLVHEVGHQGSAILNLVHSLRPILQGLQEGTVNTRIAWHCWERWISEIVADFWAVAKIGVGAALGLMSIMSLPRFFVFRMNLEDPHPFPWIRVKLCLAMGQALYPHPQWQRLAHRWESFYPINVAQNGIKQVLATLERSIPAFVKILIHHRPKLLRGASLAEAMFVEERQPQRLMDAYRIWRINPSYKYTVSPSFAFAVIGQAKADGKINAHEESRVISNLLVHYALQGTCINIPRKMERLMRYG